MNPWKEIKTPGPLLVLAPTMRTFQADTRDGGYLSVFSGREPDGWHMSISHKFGDRPGRYPTWDEIKDARYRFCPADVTMAQLLPPMSEYVNLHETTFHLWEV